MKKIFCFFTLLLAGAFLFVSHANAVVNVKGHYRNGKYIAPHVRSNPNGLKYDNYSYTPSQELYNPTYGTRGATWDTPTYITDPDYYVGKSLYDSGSSYLTTPTCPLNSYYDGISSCKCNYGYIIGSAGKCENASLYCSSKIGLMSQYNSLTKKCECMSGYEFDGLNCNRKSSSYTSPYFSYPISTYSNLSVSKNEPESNPTLSGGLLLVPKTSDNRCPDYSNSYSATQCVCKLGYEYNALKTGCTAIDLGCVNGSKFSVITGNKCLSTLTTDSQGCVSLHEYSLTTGNKCIR